MELDSSSHSSLQVRSLEFRELLSYFAKAECFPAPILPFFGNRTLMSSWVIITQLNDYVFQRPLRVVWPWDLHTSVVWGSQENSSRKLIPLEVLLICPSPLPPSCCHDGQSSNSFAKSQVMLGWRACERMVEQKGRRCLGPGSTSHVFLSLDFFYMKNITFLCKSHYF